MVTGAVVCVLWKQIGLGSVMYEIVPGFIANFIVMLAVNTFVKQDDTDMDKLYDEVQAEIKS